MESVHLLLNVGFEGVRNDVRLQDRRTVNDGGDGRDIAALEKEWRGEGVGREELVKCGEGGVGQVVG